MIELVARLQLATKRSFPESSHWLTPAEVRVFEGIKTPKRGQDWLAGRWAAKELIRKYFYEEAGRKLTPSQIEILNDENGAPYVQTRSSRPLNLELRTWNFELSLAHSAGHGLAGLTTHGSIGVDLQHIRPVRSNLAERVLTEYEREQIAQYFREQEGLLTFWALKEAAIKALRTRPAPAFCEIAVQLTEPGHPGHAEIFLRSQKLIARWGQWKEFIWAWALG